MTSVLSRFWKNIVLLTVLLLYSITVNYGSYVMVILFGFYMITCLLVYIDYSIIDGISMNGKRVSEVLLLFNFIVILIMNFLLSKGYSQLLVKSISINISFLVNTISIVLQDKFDKNKKLKRFEGYKTTKLNKILSRMVMAIWIFSLFLMFVDLLLFYVISS